MILTIGVPNQTPCLFPDHPPHSVIVYSSSASVIVKKALKCEHINKEECAKAGEKECLSTIVECEESDPDKPMHCFVVWNHDNSTGTNVESDEE